MDEQHIPIDLEPPPEPKILDPREARDRHLRRNGDSAGLLFLRTLSTQERLWMERMVNRIARTYHVDRDDLLQELHLSLLTCDTIDNGRQSVRGWLARRAKWRAADMVRATHNTHDFPLSTDDPPPQPDPLPPIDLDPDWSVDRIRHLGLNRDEAQVVLLVLWGIDVSLRDFADLAARSYQKTRQDKSRGLNKIRELFNLTPEENAAMVAHRACGTISAAAERLDISNAQFRILLRRAQQKIDGALQRRGQQTPNRRHEDESHVV